MRYELADDEWATIKPMLPNKPPRHRRHDALVLVGVAVAVVDGRHR